ncbi:nucleotidyltransferase domain-containing protein [Oceanirhabdus sp. W0125-5]|uniref:nucleotidyltransferase domain-containing protein n=1 Tax=Oceanirhabdus sp. W0125-5 TaxID=2999116 RepID=UPI0022F33FF7|nr:nucleotidyltransferase family protein [Oceanirhabdus sp. W0125-5]WBW98962.1 nucleotidyltransferase family protein [Oceanirhabdus sp. W0125-5]
MNKNQKALIDILNKSIRQEKISLIHKNLDWEYILNESKEHKITGLTYIGLNKKYINEVMSEKILKLWKREILNESLYQMNHINNVLEILEIFYENQIPVIVLKGLVLRYYYPNPYLRTMSDADILVHENNLKKCSELMESIGYKIIEESESHGAHIVFRKPGKLNVEIHWTIVNDDFFKGSKAFEKHIWDNAIKVELEGVKCLALSLEDLITHLFIHMATHIVSSGFGIRQLLDLVILIEKEAKNINWHKVIINISECGILKFSIVILNICNSLFNIDIPTEVKELDNVGEKYNGFVIEDILESGVHGRKNRSMIFAREFTFDKKEGASLSTIDILKKMILLIFPEVDSMDSKYEYAKKIRLLTPIAWVHHLISGIFHKEYSLKNKINMLMFTVCKSKKRNKLIRELEL